MTIIFERQLVNEQVLLVQFNFPSYTMNINQFDGCSLDKYLTLDAWSQIYTKLVEPLRRYKSDTTIRLKEEIIPMQRAQLELRLSWRSKKQFHTEIVREEEKKDCDLCPYVLVVKIDMVSALDKYKKEHSQKKKTDKPLTKSISLESNGLIGCDRSSNGSGSLDKVEEYVPSSRTNVCQSLKYTPSTVSPKLKITSNHITDEYTPLTHNADDEIITYTPTKIGDHSKYKTSIKTDLNRNDYPEKKKRTDVNKMTDLFGDFGDDHHSRELATTTKITPTEQQKRRQKVQPQTSLDSWITNRSKKNYSPSDGSGNEDAKKKRKIIATSPIEGVSTVVTSRCNDKEEESRKLRALREEFEAMEKQNRNSHDIDHIDLKHWSDLDIQNTFTEHEKVLKKVFQRHHHIPDARIDPPSTECNYLLILHVLVTESQKEAMCRKLRSEFCKNEPEYAITSEHENLIWKRLLPEWALQIFMRQFKFSRQDAIERLKEQDEQRTSEFPLKFDF